MPILTVLDSKMPVIRLTGEIDMGASLALIDEVNLLHDYYQFRVIKLEINSPGGNADALHHLVQSLKPWRNGDGRILKTVGLNEVASAAAFLLSFGTVGHRCVLSHSRLLYHAGRRIEPGAQTAAQLRMATRFLEQWDNCFLDLLVEHVKADKAHRKKLRRLFKQDRFLTPQQALELKLIDVVEL